MLAAAAVSLLVLDLVASGVGPAETRAANEAVVAAAVAARPGQVTTLVSVRDVLGVEAERQLLGCDDGACAAQIAGSLGARHVLAGTVLSLDGTTLVQLRLIDAQDARVLARSTAQSRRSSDLPEGVRRATFELLGVPYVAEVRHHAERANEASLRLGFHRGPGNGGVVWGSYSWRRSGWFFGPEVGLGRTLTSVFERDLPGFPDIERRVKPSWLGGGVVGGRRFSLTDGVVLYGQATLGGTLAFEPDRGTSPAFGAFVRPALGVELGGDGDLAFEVEAGYLLSSGGAAVKLANLSPLGRTDETTVRLSNSGLELALGVKLAF